MKSFILFSFILLVASVSCKKEEKAPEQITPNKIDSGTYDANSLLPLKFGAWWEYQHDNGVIERVNCGPLDTFRAYSPYGFNIPYKANILTSDYNNKELPKIEPILDGVFAANASIVTRPYRYACVKGGISSLFITNLAFNQNRPFPSFSCPNGPSYNYSLITHIRDIHYKGYEHVFVTSYTPNDAIKLNLETGEFNDPMDINTSKKPYCTSWWAQGIGLIQREIHIGDTLVDRMVLINYFIPK